MAGVSCCYGLYNYGRGDCVVIIDEVVGAIQVPLRKSDGTENKIVLASPFTSTQVTALLNNADRKARWYPMPRMYAVDAPIADTVFDEASDGTKSFVREGIWSFTGEIRDKDAVPAMLGKLKKARCTEWGVYLVTKSNQLVGEVSIDGTAVYPLRVNEASNDPKMMFKNATATNKIMVGFDFNNLVKQENLYVITGEEVGVDFNRLQKLTDVTITVSNITTTGATFKVKTSFAQGLQPNNDVVGLTELTDFEVYNNTDGAAVSITSLDEVADGEYEADWTAQTAADSLTVSMNIADTFYEGSADFLIP